MSAIVCVGIDEYHAARQALPEQYISFLPGGVDLAQFQQGDAQRGRQLLQVDQQQPLIVCCARLDKQKDQATLVKAWATSHVASDLVLVGPETSPGYAASCEAICQQFDRLPGKLHLTGGLPPEDMPDILAAAQVSVLPSRHEPFGLACLETWAAGTPLIASNVGGPKWLLEHQHCGQLFEPGNVTQLAHCLQTAMAMPQPIQQYCARGLQRARHEFSWEQRHHQLMHIYQTCKENIQRKICQQHP